MKNFPSIGIVGTGRALPGSVITNACLQKSAGLSDEWIVARTGIRERRKADTHESASTLGAQAAWHALDSAKLKAAEIDLIVCTTITPDLPMPATACLIQAQIGAGSAVCFDLSAACTGFLYGLEVAEKMLASGGYQNALLVSADLMTRRIDYADAQTCALFGDGAGAVVLSKTENGKGVIGTKLHADGALADLVYIGEADFGQVSQNDLGGAKLRMNGKRTFKVAVQKMAHAAADLLGSLGISPDKIDLVVPHQGNQRISDAVADYLAIPKTKVFSNIEKIGNTTSASIPIALDECVRSGKIDAGRLVLMTAFGSGATWGASLVRF